MSETKTEVGGVKKKRKFQETWTKESQFSWLEYDATDNAMYCSVCKKAKKKNTRVREALLKKGVHGTTCSPKNGVPISFSRVPIYRL